MLILMIDCRFEWYKEAAECWVWLHDVSYTDETGTSKPAEDVLQQFSESSWFQRGWTLQELLAPLQVVFCSHEWKVLGCKRSESDWSLTDIIDSRYGRHFRGDDYQVWGRLQQAATWSSEIILWAITECTGIPSEALYQPDRIRRYSVAQRMSWASKRKTTRIEDEAYCLLGLFRTNMPLLYGEGRRAFQRLQQEIIRCSHDESIYAWAVPSPQHLPLARHSPTFAIIARSPADFSGSGDIVRTLGIQRSPWTVTHHGLEVPLVPDNETGIVELPGYTVGRLELKSNFTGDQPTVAISFPLACKREKDADSMPCKLIITRLRCAHWGRVVTDNLVGRRPMNWTPTTIKFDRQKVYIHIDECEDLPVFASAAG